MKKFLLLTLSIIVIAGLALVSCAKEAAPAAPTATTPAKPAPTTAAPSPVPSATTAPDARLPNLGDLAKPAGGKEGGRLQLQAGLNISNIGDPTGPSGPSDAAYSNPVVEPLCIIDQDNNLKPWLAEEIIPAQDGSSITLKLRKGISFTDGTPFNADAAKYNLDNGINSKLWPNMRKVKECVIVDPYTIRLDFVDGKWDWVAVKSLAGFWSVMMFSPTSLKNNTSEYKKTHVVGTGPFILKEYVRDQYLKYDRNDNYWRGKPYLDGIDWNVIAQTEVALLAYKGGKLHSLGVWAKDAEGLIKDGFVITKNTDTISNFCLVPSSANPTSPLADIRVRRAVEYAIDKKELVDGLTYGYGVATNQEFGLPPYMDPTTVGYPYDVAMAKKLLADAGYTNGIKITVYHVDGFPEELGLALQGQLKKAGIEIKIEKTGYIKFVQMSQGGEGWEGYMIGFGFSGTTVDPAISLGNGPLNAMKIDGKWTNTIWMSSAQPMELLELFAQQSKEIDVAKRKAMIQQISKKMTDNYCVWTFLYYTPGLISTSPILKGATIGQYKEFNKYTFAWLQK